MGKRGPKKTPTKTLRLRGSWLADTRGNEPEPKAEQPDMPKWLKTEAKREWKRIVPLLLAQGLLTKLDRTVLAIYCQTYAEYLEAEKLLQRKKVLIKTANGNLVQNPAIAVRNRARDMLLKAAAEIGMTPSGRSSISLPQEPSETDKSAKKFFDRIA